MSYKSPIEIIKKMQEQYETDVVNNVVKCVQSYAINVDKEELIKALKYDRHEYERGYDDGVRFKADLLEKFADYLSDKYRKLWREYNKQYETSPQSQNDEEMNSDTSHLLGICCGISMVLQNIYSDLEDFLVYQNDLAKE